MKITVIGSGYVGLVTGTCFADIGHQVTCVDLDERKINLLKDAVSPIFEPGIDDLIDRNLKNKRLSFTTSLKDAMVDSKVAFIAVGTPEGEDGSADLKYVYAVAKDIAQNITGDLVVVVKSTVPVGTCDQVQKIIQENLGGRSLQFKVSVASNPEFLKEGTAITDFMRPDRIVVGINQADRDWTEKVFHDLYALFVIDDPSKLFIVDRRSSELVKYASNSMLAVRISFMNELSRLCEKMGADIDHVRRGMGLDGRIGKKFLWAGPGYGGSCFPKDVSALIKTGEQHGEKLEILTAAQTANEKQKEHVARKISNQLGDLKGKTIAIWGLSFKPGTDDVREAPAKTIISHLVEKGGRVNAHDPQGEKNFAKEFNAEFPSHAASVSYADEAYKTLENADALVLVTEWSEYKKPDWQRVKSLLKTKVVFDLRNQYEYSEIQSLGFKYYAVGRPDDSAVVKTL